MNCPHCGYTIDSSAKRCNYCYVPTWIRSDKISSQPKQSGEPSTMSVGKDDIAQEVRPMCEMCNVIEAVPLERFCVECRKAKLQEMKEAGYLTNAPIAPGWGGPPRGQEAREDVEQTRHGMLKCGNDFDSKDWDEKAT